MHETDRNVCAPSSSLFSPANLRSGAGGGAVMPVIIAVDSQEPRLFLSKGV